MSSELLYRSRKIHVPNEFATVKLSKVLDLYVNWYDGDVAAAKVKLIQDVIELGDPEEVSKCHAGIFLAVQEGNG